MGFQKIRDNVGILTGTTAPTDGTTGAGVAGAGSLYIDQTNLRVYRNIGSKASPTWDTVTTTVTVVAAGRNGAGAITATGFKVGDKVRSAVNLTDGTHDTANFESTITVADQIQQSSASNLTTKKYIFQVQR